jgi:hypothetical protein
VRRRTTSAINIRSLISATVTICAQAAETVNRNCRTAVFRCSDDRSVTHQRPQMVFSPSS